LKDLDYQKFTSNQPYLYTKNKAIGILSIEIIVFVLFDILSLETEKMVNKISIIIAGINVKDKITEID